MELLGSNTSEFSDVNFCPVPQNNNLTFTFAHGTMLGSDLLHYTENDNSEFFQANQSFFLTSSSLPSFFPNPQGQ